MWDILPNQDEAMIADAARAYLAGELPIERLRPNAPPVDAEAVRNRMAKLGWFGVGLPENAGGSGMGLVEEALIQRECGRFLASPSVLATVLAGHVAVAAGDTDLARALATGNAEVAMALIIEPDGAGLCDALAFDRSSNALVLAWNERGMGLFEPACLAGTRTDECLDNSVAMESGRIALDRARHWISPAEAPLVLRAKVLLAAGLAGLAEHACDLTVGYAKVREQFGKPIGSFQAVKHRCADMAVRARLAWYQTCLAALKLRERQADAEFQAACAKLVAGRAAHENARAAIQLHGAIGFQSECDAHWFMKRAHLYDRLGGDGRELARWISRNAMGAAKPGTRRTGPMC